MQQLSKKRKEARTGFINRLGGCGLRTFSEDNSAMSSEVYYQAKVDIITTATSKVGTVYYLINQFGCTLEDGSTPHGWINANYIGEEP